MRQSLNARAERRICQQISSASRRRGVNPTTRSCSSGMVSRRRERRRAAPRSDGAGDRDARRASFGARRAESRRQPRRLRLLHQLQQPQSRRPRRQSARRDRLSLAEARAAAARRGTRAQTDAPRIGAVFSNAPAREPPQRVGVAAERDRFRDDRFSKRNSRACRRVSAMAEFRVRRSGEAFGLSRIVSSSGRDNRIACTIACFIDEKEKPGRFSGLHPRETLQFPW